MLYKLNPPNSEVLFDPSNLDMDPIGGPFLSLFGLPAWFSRSRL